MKHDPELVKGGESVTFSACVVLGCLLAGGIITMGAIIHHLCGL